MWKHISWETSRYWSMMLIHVWPNDHMNYEIISNQNIFHLSETAIILFFFLLDWHVCWRLQLKDSIQGPVSAQLRAYVSDDISSASVWVWAQHAIASSLSKWLCLWGSCDLAPLDPDKRFGCPIRTTPPGQRRKLDSVRMDAERLWMVGLRARWTVWIWVFMSVWTPNL